MTANPNNRCLDTDPVAWLVAGNLQGGSENDENNRTLIQTGSVCRNWRNNASLIQARTVARMNLRQYRIRQLPCTNFRAIMNDFQDLAAHDRSIEQLFRAFARWRQRREERKRLTEESKGG